MKEHCLVICGEWICGGNNVWDFRVDKEQMTRIVSIDERISLKELKERVLGEFFVDGGVGKTVHLSYWPPNSKELATGIETPPVLVTHDGAISFFFQHLRVNPSINMFVKFEDLVTTARLCVEVESLSGFTTPVSRVSKAVTMDAGFSGETSKHVSTIDRNDGQGSVDTKSLKKKPVQRSRLYQIGCTSADDKGDYPGAVHDGWYPVCEIDVRPRGYDTEFWEPVIEEMYASPERHDFAEGDMGNSGEGLIYKCSTGSAFDHDVWVSGTSGTIKTEGRVRMPGPTPSFDVHIDDTAAEDDDSAWNKTPTRESEVNASWGSGLGIDGSASGNEPRDTTSEVTEASLKRDTWMRGQPSVAVQQEVRSRDLSAVDDEEFDIPPLYDDLSYEVAEFPDLDYDDGDDDIYAGKVFGSKKDCQIALAIYAIKNQFSFVQYPTKRHYFVLSCVDKRCDWRVLAIENVQDGYYKIGTAQLNHNCPLESRNSFKKKASDSVLAALYKSKFKDPSKAPKPSDLQEMVLEDLRVSCSYMKCYRAAEKATISIRGSDDNSYLKLPEYLHLLKVANPGTVTDLETEVDEEGVERFVYAFVSFGASKEGFTKLRRVLVVDGTHLTGKYKGVLLTACGQDANFQVFPLAWAVVDCEDTESWTWFFERVEKILADSPNLTIISDRAAAIYAAKRKVYPLAYHGACIVHLARNVVSRFKSKGLGKMVTKAAFACKVGDFRDHMGKIKAASVGCLTYLEKIGVAHWCRAYCGGARYNIMSSNICEQLNGALVKGRGSPIMELFIFIQSMMTRWFNARRNKSIRHRGDVTPEVDKVMTEHRKFTKASKINMISPWSAEVVGQFGGKNQVQLREKKCSCKVYDKELIPCGHALLAGDRLGLQPHTLVAEWYKTSHWVDTYSGIVNPVGNADEVEIPEETQKMVLMPPRTKRPKGRPQALRFLSTGEIRSAKKTKTVPNRCGRCREVGHNRTNCTKPL